MNFYERKEGTKKSNLTTVECYKNKEDGDHAFARNHGISYIGIKDEKLLQSNSHSQF